MDPRLHLNLRPVFTPTMQLAEVFLRRTVIYLFLFFILRLLRREAGAIGITHLLVIVLISDAAQNAMASDYRSIERAVQSVESPTLIAGAALR